MARWHPHPRTCLPVFVDADRERGMCIVHTSNQRCLFLFKKLRESLMEEGVKRLDSHNPVFAFPCISVHRNELQLENHLQCSRECATNESSAFTLPSPPLIWQFHIAQPPPLSVGGGTCLDVASLSQCLERGRKYWGFGCAPLISNLVYQETERIYEAFCRKKTLKV